MDFLINLVLVGVSDPGKSCLMRRFCDDVWDPSAPATIGADFRDRTIELDGKRIKLHIVRAHSGHLFIEFVLIGFVVFTWDTSGKERFRTVIPAYYRGAMGILLVYDVTDERSFTGIRTWHSSIKTHASEGVNKILVGNKCDWEAKRMVTREQGQELADELGIKFFETSAKYNVGVEEVFFTLARDIKTRLFDIQP
ncbi:GTP-binding protein [Tulasnella sp. 424]|nr:GTP-binding protein [Tulasnella sp. 424]